MSASSLNAAELAQVIDELSTRWSGGQIQKIHMLGPHRVSLKLRVPGQSGVLHISVDPELAGVFLSDERGASDPEASAFCMLLRRHLKGGRLEELIQIGGDRVVRLGGTRALLVAEMLGRRGSLVLCDAESTILATSPASGGRPGLERGAVYQPPPGGGQPPRESGLAPGRANEEARARLDQPHDASDDRREQLVKRLAGKLKKAGKRLSRIEADLKRSKGAAELQRRGELLQIHLGGVRKGMRSVAVPDLLSGDDPPAQVEIALDPSRSPAENMEKLFAKARKARRAGVVARERRDETAGEIRGLEALLERVRESDESELEELAREAGVRLGAVSTGPRRRRDAPRLPYRAYRDCRGDRVLVGRSAGDNDRLTVEVARPNDLWLHARGVPGSHVVAPLNKGAQIDSERLLDAATLAAHFSDAKKNTVVEVAYTPRRYVQKPRKAPPGQVLLLREKVLNLRLEDERLRRLLKARIES